MFTVAPENAGLRKIVDENFRSFRRVFKAGTVCLPPPPTLTEAALFCALPHWMSCSRVSLRSSGPENNEGVCCINLCNGEREEGGVQQGREGGGGEERRVMSSCCCTAALLYTLCMRLSQACTHSGACTRPL